ncbi:MAG: hypothetical protein CMM01_17655 [Rhodopirellula sp.]|nr:hypothetical protein [Rhodopirellula sp.]
MRCCEISRVWQHRFKLVEVAGIFMGFAFDIVGRANRAVMGMFPLFRGLCQFTTGWNRVDG